MMVNFLLKMKKEELIKKNLSEKYILPLIVKENF